MTVDDENSIYVGGIPYDTTDEILRKHFDSYGHIVAVKIVNDRSIGGKCYGFVTFSNPRSALDAIENMNGTKIDGRVIRVNEVQTRGGRTNFNRDAGRRSTDRGSVWDRSRNQDNNFDKDNDRYRDHDDNHYRKRKRSIDRDQGRESGREDMHDRDRGRERGQDYMHDHDRTRDHFLDREQEGYHEGFDKEHKIDHDQNSERGQDAERSRYLGTKRNDDHGKVSDERNDQRSNKQSSFSGPDNRGYSSPSSGGHPDQVKKQLESSISSCEDLHNEISHWEVKVQDQDQRFSDSHKQAQKLEDTLIMARKLRQQRQMQLMKLFKCFSQVKDCTGRLKSLEQELEELCDSTMTELDFNSVDVVRSGVTANGSA